MKYYHITEDDRKTLKSILRKGLKCNIEGEIFLFENVSISFNGVKNNVADMIAANQLGLSRFTMIEIDSEGLNTELIKDNVAELSSDYQWILKQPLILPEFIKYVGTYDTKYHFPFNV